MIAGTFAFEGTIINFTLVYKTGPDLQGLYVDYIVQDGLTGETHSVSTKPENFAAAMALALGGDKMAGASVLYPFAEQCQPQGEDRPCRWIP